MKRIDLRFLAIWILCLMIGPGACAVVLGALLAALDANGRVQAVQLFHALEPLPYLVAIGWAILSAFLASWIRSAYFTPMRRAADAVGIMADVNDAHRLELNGPTELRTLLGAVNQLGHRLWSEANDTQARITEARRALELEKNRLAVLMSELPQSVIVCDAQARIVLYNEQARRLFSFGEPGKPASWAYLGLGRSLYALLSQAMVDAALQRLSTRCDGGELSPVETLTVRLTDGRPARVRLAALPAAHSVEGPTGGFVLLLEDTSEEISGIERHRIVLTELVTEATSALAVLAPTLERIARAGAADAAQTLDPAVASCRRLSAAVEAARTAHSALDRANTSELENVGTTDLAALIAAAVRQGGLTVKPQETSGSGTHAVRSPDLMQTMRYIAHRLHDAFDIREATLNVTQAKDRLVVELGWLGHRLSGATLAAWEDDTLSLGGEASAMTLRELLARQTAELAHDIDRASGRCRVVVTLPTAQRTLPAQTRIARPIFYDFDLRSVAHGDVISPDVRLADLAYTVFDTETTGLDPAGGDEIISIGAIRIVNGRMLEGETFDQLIDTERRIHPEAVKVHGIRPELLRGEPRLDIVLPRFHAFCEDTVLVGHNVAFDLRFLQMKEASTGIRFRQPVLDTLLLAGALHADLDDNRLEAIAHRFGIEVVGRHTALGDAHVTAEVFLKTITLLAARGIYTLGEAQAACAKTRYAKLTY